MNFRRGKHWRWTLGSMAALVTVMTTAANPQDKDGAAMAQTATRQRPSAPATADGADSIDRISLERLKRARMQVKKADLFSAKSWYVPPPPPPPAPTPPPSAPPLPFTFLGKIQESAGKLTIFLAGENRVYLVSEGETIDDTYHVDGVENGKLALTYLPMQIKQYVEMGEAP